MSQTDYPDDWEKIAREIKNRSGWMCEHCGVGHNPAGGYCLTVHHLDGDKSNCAYENLVALCQRCHLHIQAVYYPGQLMFSPYPWAVKRGLQ
jgi:5-methylcytosine-specific restriction endonuclease McrA